MSKQTETDFLHFLGDTLIPDLKMDYRTVSAAVGHDVADFFEDVLEIIYDAKYKRSKAARMKDNNELDYIASEVIPDLEEAGYFETAKDLARAVTIARKRLAKMPKGSP